VTNNPAAGSNGMFLDITSPMGDVETPLYVAFTNGTSGLGATGRFQSGLAMRRRGTVATTPFFLQAEAMTQGVDTTTQVNSATFSGSGNNSSAVHLRHRHIRAAAAHDQPVADGSSVDYRGTYRVFMRCKKTVAGDSIDVQLQWGTSSPVISNDIVTLPADANLKYIDLGLVQFPGGYDPVYRRPVRGGAPGDGHVPGGVRAPRRRAPATWTWTACCSCRPTTGSRSSSGRRRPSAPTSSSPRAARGRRRTA
jgi:hypothetical protein